MKRLLALLVVLAAGRAGGAALPGFGVRFVGTTAGFPSSLAVDSGGILYYSTTAGDIYRLVEGQSVPVAHVVTDANGNSGLLGMALRGDGTAVVHYTTPRQVADVISTVDLESGAETMVHAFTADIEVASRGSSPEHHGGNPIVAADGSVFVAIGDYGGWTIAALPEWNGGKVWRIFPDGTVQQFARGFRNPFDVAWDAANQRLIVPDNGELADDEINIVHLGDDCGWPRTSGNGPAIPGTVAPSYVFPTVVAPTGIAPLGGHNPVLRHGYLLSAFVSKAIYYIDDVDHPAPIAIVQGETGPIIDVTEGANGDVYFCTGNAVYQLLVPQRGDSNGDGKVDYADIETLTKELADAGNSERMTDAQNGAVAASWGSDVNGDGVIDKADLAALYAIVHPRVRAFRPGH